MADGLVQVRAQPPAVAARSTVLALRDEVAARRGRAPVLDAGRGPAGRVAGLTSPGLRRRLRVAVRTSAVAPRGIALDSLADDGSDRACSTPPDLARSPSASLRGAVHRDLDDRFTGIPVESHQRFSFLRRAAWVRPVTSVRTQVSRRTPADVWPARRAPHPVVAELAAAARLAGAIASTPTCRSRGADVWASATAARSPTRPRTTRRHAADAQHAIRQGRLVARNVAAAISGGKRKKFTLQDQGRRRRPRPAQGRRRHDGHQVARARRRVIIARTYHLAMMPGLGRRARLLTDWNVGLLFGRDVAELGQLGRVTGLGGAPLEAHSAGGTGVEARPVDPSEAPQEDTARAVH
jgi:hypothetical protein